MKQFNKHILEAVHRGIQLALDDYEDIEDNNSISHYNDIINNEDVIKNKIEFWKEWVDLGLPSGTIWCKHDLDNKTYSWGEIEPFDKLNFDPGISDYDEYSWSKYKFSINDTNRNLFKYCTDSIYWYYGTSKPVDNLTQLLPEDDVVCQKMHIGNYKISMPTKEQCEELLKYTTYTNRKLISIINNNILDIEMDYTRFGIRTEWWSSSLYEDNNQYAYNIKFYEKGCEITHSIRYNNYHIRPVLNL